MADSIHDIIRLLAIPGIGPRKTLDLFNHFQSIGAIFAAQRHQLFYVPGIHEKLAEVILKPVDEELVHGQLRLMEKFEVKLVTIWDAAYPKLLKDLYDPPIALFCRGDVELFNTPSIGMVGTRTPTAYGREVARELSSGLAREGYTLVSGAAKGIDTQVHTACLQQGGKTIAVLGNGIDRCYPAENKELYGAIGSQGLLVSEFLMGSKPDAPNFPRRNRIISGLSAGIVVIEAAEKSGSLITAYYALDQNREVFAVPGSIKSRQSRGTHRLIKQGAKLVETIDDVLEELGEKFRLGRSTGQQELVISADPKELVVLEQLREDQAIQIDELAELTGQATFTLLGTLLPLEMKGLVQQLPGKYFKRK